MHEPQTKRTQWNTPWASIVSLTHHYVTQVLHQIGSTEQRWNFTTHTIWGEEVSFCPSLGCWFAEKEHCWFAVERDLLSMGILCMVYSLNVMKNQDCEEKLNPEYWDGGCISRDVHYVHDTLYPDMTWHVSWRMFWKIRLNKKIRGSSFPSFQWPP